MLNMVAGPTGGGTGTTIARGNGTLLQAAADGPVKLRLSRMRSEASCESIAEELRALYEAAPLEADWVIDLSDVVHPPLALMTALYHLTERLHAEGRDVSVVGLDARYMVPSELAS
jgi:hypothetical protein